MYLIIAENAPLEEANIIYEEYCKVSLIWILRAIDRNDRERILLNLSGNLQVKEAEFYT